MKKVAERLSALGVLAFAVGALAFLSAPMASLTPAIAQQTVRDSVFALLADQTIPASGFIHLYDSTPYSITNGHVAAKIPCDDESTPLLNILVGVAPNLTAASLELVPPLSTAGELCLYHVDLPPPAQANATSANATTTTMITDIAIQNPGDEDITLPSTSTVVIGVNEITRGAHSHEEGEQAQAGAP
jgi:hypothetical protein